MKKAETVFKERFRIKLDEIPYSWFFKVTLPSLLGIPDIIGVVRGKFVALELKRSEKESPSRIQRYHLNLIKECGGYAAVVHPENCDVILHELNNIK